MSAAQYFTGEWNHLFGPGKRETRCRIAIDQQQGRVVAAQEWTGLKFENMSRARLADLNESVIEVNEAHLNPVTEFGLVGSESLPDWAAPVAKPARACRMR